MKKITQFLTEMSATLLLIISFFLLIAIAVCWCFCTQESCGIYGSFVGGSVGCLISIANAILLYVTLKTQQEDLSNAKKKSEREHFENTFFRMTEQLETLTKNIFLSYEDLDESSLELSNKSICGKYFFVFFEMEMQRLDECSEKDLVYHKYDNKSFEDELVKEQQAINS
ncbi:MAG: hypothetical protein J6W69_03325, partial [Bacteroidales bacterium]|nr:hypothetical protein [Bacteroidales bacterium]